MSIKNYSDVSTVSFSGCSFTNTFGNSVEARGLGTALNLGNTVLGVPSSVVTTGNAGSGVGDGTQTAYSILTSVGDGSASYPTAVNASGCTFTGLATATDAGRFSAQARLLDAIDSTARGLVTLLANNVYVPSGGSVAAGAATCCIHYTGSSNCTSNSFAACCISSVGPSADAL